MTRDPNTLPIPAPDPARPTVAAPAPMYLAAWSMSRFTALVWMERSWLTIADTWGLAIWEAMPLYEAMFPVDGSCLATTVLLRGLRAALEIRLMHRAEGAANLAQAYMFVGVGC